jgi:beta-N-acetylhexosaminidase
MRIILLFSFFHLLFFTCFAQTDSLDIKIGQMIMVGMQGNIITDQSSILLDIKNGTIGGILLYEYNLNPIQTEKKLNALTTRLKANSKIPLLISIDQEGGQVNRMKTKYGFPAMPSAKSVGIKNDDAYTMEVAQTIANSLARVNINVNYAPVLDVDNAMCPVLGKRQRCYSNNPEEIAHFAAITIEAHHAKNIKTVVKHFPGHGNSMTDTHLGMADVSKLWKHNELLPYKMLIDRGLIDCIMTAHIINKKLDASGLPATLSRKIIHGVLRTQLSYDGVVISDDMQMHAISSYYGFEESIKKCINAGVDILMFSNNIKGTNNYSPSNVHATIKKLVKEGEISLSRINESFIRILKMKATL